ncbi:hypothetical protein [Mycobacterium gastri]|uniref:Colicin D immunity protein domain-containing protein n=1 Tax=Mycobacterium gastri TaxID=1777 RepID=A0A1X1VUX6_MYCGS|nr:hypothetical protein [Mycobacterium gastri]ETW25211.1 hypothetical protein MGAST_03940 [Mycobacterium gastri 'Wayne']ORV72894.1 hypothetical protein AWC07_03150 [Mycobacterium gastri]
MTNDDVSRDRTAYLRQLALDSLNSYGGGFADLERVDRDLKSIIRSLNDVADPSWTSSLLRLWGQLEIIYALALDEERFRLSEEDEAYVQGVIAELRAKLRGYNLPPVRDTDEETR